MKATVTASLALLMLASVQTGAQSHADVAQSITQARKENAEQTRNYSWTRRTEVKVKGEVKNLKTELVRYDVDGELQVTPISQDQAKGPKGVRGKVAKKKAGEMKDWMAELGELLHEYSLPTAGALLDFLDQAEITPEGAGHKLAAADVVVTGDLMTLWIDEDFRLSKTEVATHHDGSDVQLTTDHAETPDGLDYTARTNIVVPDKNVAMTVENFSYKRER